MDSPNCDSRVSGEEAKDFKVSARFGVRKRRKCHFLAIIFKITIN